MKITSQFHFGPNLARGGGGLQRFSNVPKYYRFLDLKASLSGLVLFLTVFDVPVQVFIVISLNFGIFNYPIDKLFCLL